MELVQWQNPEPMVERQTVADPAELTSESMSADRRQQRFVSFVIGLKGTRVLSTRNIIFEQIRDITHSMKSAAHQTEDMCRPDTNPDGSVNY